jgi:predicted RNA polymerase sigma factor
MSGEGSPTSKRLEVIERTLGAGSKDPFVWYARAMELRSLGRGEDALRAFVALEAHAANYVPTYLMAAQVAGELGRVAEARTWCEKGIAQARTTGDSHALSELESHLGTLPRG